LTIPDGVTITAAAVGLFNSSQADDKFRVLTFVENFADAGAGNAIVRIVHASPDAPAVDIYAGNAKLVNGLAFGDLSAPIQVAPGSYTLSFRDSQSGAEAATATTPVLAAGERYLAVASGYLLSGSPSFTMLPYADAFDPNSSDPLVRVIHASPDADAVDVGTVDSGMVTAVGDYSDLSFGEASSAVGTALPVGVLPIGVASTGDTTPLASFDVATASGVRAFAVAAGSVAGPGEAFRLLLVDTSTYPWASAEVLPKVE
jgi:hypothetical protein